LNTILGTSSAEVSSAVGVDDAIEVDEIRNGCSWGIDATPELASSSNAQDDTPCQDTSMATSSCIAQPDINETANPHWCDLTTSCRTQIQIYDVTSQHLGHYARWNLVYQETVKRPMKMRMGKRGQNPSKVIQIQSASE